MNSLSHAIAGGVLTAVLLVLVLAAPASLAGKPPTPRNAALIGDDVFFEIGDDSFLVPLAALRYPSALRAPIVQFYFDAPIDGVTAQLVRLDSVSCNYSVAQASAGPVLQRLGNQVAGAASPWQSSAIAGGMLHGLESYRQVQGAGAWEDWFILRDSQRRVRTSIRCGSAGDDDGGGGAGISFCTHLVDIDPVRGERLRLRYPRAYLGAWRDIEQQVKTLLHEFKRRGREATAYQAMRAAR